MKRTLTICAIMGVGILVIGTLWQTSASGQSAGLSIPGGHPTAKISDGTTSHPVIVADPAGTGTPKVIDATTIFSSGMATDGNAEELLKQLPDDLQSLSPERLQQLDHALEAWTGRLVGQYRDTTEEEKRSQIESQLREVVEQHFAVRQAMRNREIAELEQEVRRLRELLEARERTRQEIVGGRIDQLLRSARGLGWDGQATQPGVTVVSPFGMTGTIGPARVPRPARPATSR